VYMNYKNICINICDAYDLETTKPSSSLFLENMGGRYSKHRFSTPIDVSIRWLILAFCFGPQKSIFFFLYTYRAVEIRDFFIDSFYFV